MSTDDIRKILDSSTTKMFEGADHWHDAGYCMQLIHKDGTVMLTMSYEAYKNFKKYQEEDLEG